LSEVGINKGTGGLCEFDWIGVGFIMSDMMVGNCYGDLNPEQYLLCLTKDAVSIIKMLQNTGRRRRPGAQCDARSIMMHPFFKTVNWEAVLEKRVTPPLQPLTLDYLTVEAEAPGDACDLGRNPSNEHTHCETMVEQPPLQQLTLVYLTDDEEAPDDACDLARNPSSEHKHSEAIVEQPPLQPQTLDCLPVDTEAPVKCPIVDSRANDKMKKLVTVVAAAAAAAAAAAVVVVVFSFVLLGSVLYNF